MFTEALAASDASEVAVDRNEPSNTFPVMPPPIDDVTSRHRPNSVVADQASSSSLPTEKDFKWNSEQEQRLTTSTPVWYVIHTHPPPADRVTSGRHRLGDLSQYTPLPGQSVSFTQSNHN